MAEWLLRLLAKKYGDADASVLRMKAGKAAGIGGILCNLLLFAAKLTVGLASGSVSVVADAANSLSDAASSGVTLLGFRMAQRPADAEHPFGHARYEYLSGLITAVWILLVGGELAAASVKKILHPEELQVSAALFIVLTLSVALKLAMFRIVGALGRRIRSSALRAAAADSRNDAIASAAVLAGCAVRSLWGVNADGYIGLGVALFILYSGISIAREAVSPLLGRRADEELVARIRDAVLAQPEILGIHDLLVHDYGPGRCFASLHAEMRGEAEAAACHEIVDAIEEKVYRELQVQLVIHVDPVKEGTQTKE